MTKYYFLFLLIPFVSFAQVGINTTSPHASSMLDVSADDKGLLIPQVSLRSFSDTVTISDPAIGLLIFKPETTRGMSSGFYYWNGTVWTQLITDVSTTWSTSGNTVEDSDFIGTINEKPLVIKVNDSVISRFYPNGALGIGHGTTVVPDGIAIGTGAIANNELAISIGKFSQAQGQFGTAVGVEARANDYNNTAVGHLAHALGRESLAIGGGAIAGTEPNDSSAVAIGPFAKATKRKSFALGPNTKATAVNSFALGISAIADRENTIILGEARTDTIAETPHLVGIGTRNPRARLDVNGRFIFGQNGTVSRNVISFEHLFTTTTTIAADTTEILTIPIPENNQPFTFKATVMPTLSTAFPDQISVSWVKLNDLADEILIKLKNDSSSEAAELINEKIYFTILEFD